MSEIKCKICGKNTCQKDIQIYSIKEMMVGTKEEFKYMECPHCKSLQIIEIPEDMGEYYNQNYYSFGNINPFVKKLFYHLNKYYLEGDWFGQILDKFIDGNKSIYEFIKYHIEKNKLSHNSQILDVGCGNGYFLEMLADLGFNDLNGMEPFIEEQINSEKFTIFKSFLDDFNPKKFYDLIFFNDSLEHMDNPYQNLLNAKELLKDEGYLIISIPIKSDYFWDLYGVNWYQLDAPRHFITFTLDGFNDLLTLVDLEIEMLSFNSNPLVFIFSEDYSNGIPMNSKESYLSKSDLKNRFKRTIYKINFKDTKVDFKYLQKIIEDLNDEQKSEHAIFLIKKVNK